MTLTIGTDPGATMNGKISTGIAGFDAIAGGGLPEGRVVSVFGGAGTGKTIFGLQTLAHRMRDHREHTIFVTFEQASRHVLSDVASFNWGFEELAAHHLSLLDAGIQPEMIHNGQFDLEALIVGLSGLIHETQARTVVLDGIDALLSLLDAEGERRELLRLMSWLRGAKVTGIVTAKPGDARERSASRAELLEYQSDCVIHLDSVKVANTVSRTLQMVKYRGSRSDGDLVPMVFTSGGIEVIAANLPRAAVSDAPRIETTRYSSGLPDLDALLDGGYRRGSTTLISGAPGTAKSTLAAAFVLSSADAGLSSIYLSFDETPEQISSHMASVGFDVGPAMKRGALVILSLQSGGLPPEIHVERILHTIDTLDARAIVIDPISAIMRHDHPYAMRITEYLLVELRKRKVTMLCTSLLEGTASGITESTQSQVSTLADTWIHLSYIATGGERNRALTIVKSRGTAHSNQVRELLLSDTGLTLQSVYSADGDVLLGTARLQKEASDRRKADVAAQEQGLRESQIVRELDSLTARLRDLERDLDGKRAELSDLKAKRQTTLEADEADRLERLEARTSRRGSAEDSPEATL